MIDYKEIVKNLELSGVKSLLDSLDIPFREVDVALIMPTVCHNENVEEASWKLYYYKDSHIFYCYTEDGGMSIFSFLRKFYETRQIVYDWYADVLQAILNCSASKTYSVNPQAYRSRRDEYEPRKVQKRLEIHPHGLLDMFVSYYPVEWLADSISPEAMDKHNIKFSISQNKIIIPHYNTKGELIGIRGRALNPAEAENFGKYMPVQIEGKWYSHPLSLNLYSLDKNWKNIEKSGIAYVFEGEKSCLQFESFSLLNCAVASCGSNFNKYQLDLLVRKTHVREVVLCYDSEEITGEDKYFQKLYQICKKYNNYCTMSFIYDRQGLLPKKASPSDHGEAIFRELLHRRVKVR